ncbi:DUF1285 domain-containing protein [Shewanella algae]
MKQSADKVSEALKGLGARPDLCQQQALFEIDVKGDWYYLNSPLPAKFARLFSSILHCIEGEHLLITPAERLKVAVADTPLIIVDYKQLDIEAESSRFALVCSQGNEFEVLGLNAFESAESGLLVRLPRGLKARLGRACFYRFAETYLLS